MRDPFRDSLDGVVAKIARLRVEVAELESKTSLTAQLETLENEQLKLELRGTPPPNESAADKARLTVIWGTACAIVSVPLLGLREKVGVYAQKGLVEIGWLAVVAFSAATVFTGLYLAWRGAVRARRARCMTRSDKLKAAIAKLRSDAASAAAPSVATTDPPPTSLQEAHELAEALESRLDTLRTRSTT